MKQKKRKSIKIDKKVYKKAVNHTFKPMKQSIMSYFRNINRL